MSDAAIFQRRFEALAANVEDFIRGKPEVVRLALVCLLAEGHLLIEDVPGVAKTSLAKAIARSVAGAEVKRIQFTPDLLPSDVTGVQVYDQGRSRFEFRRGPVFTNILLGDEINRASPKTQSALLEVMAEGQVTVDGRPVPVPHPFLCIATQNPVEHQGTYALPEAQLDRFMMRISIGYPDDLADEVGILSYGVTRRRPDELKSVMELDDLRLMIRAVREQRVADTLREYVARIVRATRVHPDVELGVSPRGGIALVTAAQAYALAAGRPYVTADDVKAVAVPVLNHRLLLTPEARIQHRTAESVLADVLAAAPVPAGR
ncbi:MoxR family ATPase [Lentzea sp. NPDC004782]|uniref:AAA family ATPase n=1 Tax=Lentzea sp. NPDC004782 TaxID=3154458 RepID=UPI0033A92DD2